MIIICCKPLQLQHPGAARRNATEAGLLSYNCTCGSERNIGLSDLMPPLLPPSTSFGWQSPLSKQRKGYDTVCPRSLDPFFTETKKTLSLLFSVSPSVLLSYTFPPHFSFSFSLFAFSLYLSIVRSIGSIYLSLCSLFLLFVCLSSILFSDTIFLIVTY